MKTKPFKTHLDKLAELPPNIAKLALANVKKKKGKNFLEYQKEKATTFADAINYCFSWSGSKERFSFWSNFETALEGIKKITRIIPGPKNLEYKVFLINNTLHVGCQQYPLTKVKKFFAAWDGKKEGWFGNFEVENGFVIAADGPSMPVKDVRKIGKWLKPLTEPQ